MEGSVKEEMQVGDVYNWKWSVACLRWSPLTEELKLHTHSSSSAIRELAADSTTGPA